MSQLGMQMPGSAGARRSSLTVYDALMFLAVVCLGAAVATMWLASTQVSPQQGAMAPFSLQQPNQISLPNAGD